MFFNGTLFLIKTGYVKQIVFSFFFLIAIQSNLHSQILLHSLTNLPHNSYGEKIYLQLDNSNYITGETIWFKTIVANAVDHSPTLLSKVLYVELISANKLVIDRKILKLENGIANSFFQTQSKYTPGVYQVRAYTKWNKNFESDFVSTQYINLYWGTLTGKPLKPIQELALIEQDSGRYMLSAKLYPKLLDSLHRGKVNMYLNLDAIKDSITIKKNKSGDYLMSYMLPKDTKLTTLRMQSKNLITHSKTIATDLETIDLLFFPEGGALVNKLESVVAFKALDAQGRGKVVSGTVIDNLDNVVVSFKSNALGMGVFIITPESSKTYHAILENDTQEKRKHQLPDISKGGTVLSVNNSKTHIKLSISSNVSKGDSIFIRGRSRGVTYYFSKSKMKENIVYTSILKENFPEGIVELTLLDKHKRPICERLVYNKYESRHLKLELITNKTTYQQREKTELEIKVFNKENKPVKANVSVMVVNKEALEKPQQTIESYFLLHSDLKGTIEAPSHYFNASNKHRTQDLDALLLTQGWRNYKYQKSKTFFKYKPERELFISGSVGEMLNPLKARHGCDLTLATFGDYPNVINTTIDSTGRFKFRLGAYYDDKLKVLIQTKDKKGKNQDYTINLDKDFPFLIDFDEKRNIERIDSILSKQLAIKTEGEVLVNRVRGFKLSKRTIELDEVVVDGYKMTTEREKMMEAHGKPDIIIEGEDIQKAHKKWPNTFYGVLMDSYPREISIDRIYTRYGSFLWASVHANAFTFVLVDGNIVLLEDYPLLEILPVEEIKSVEILEDPKNQFKYLFEVLGPLAEFEDYAFLSIYTHGGKGLISAQRFKGMYKGEVSVFASKKEFYTPEYENLDSQDWSFPDQHTLVYWNPEVKTDTNENYSSSFYNADTIGDVIVIVEAIDEFGNVAYKEVNYEVVANNENN